MRVGNRAVAAASLALTLLLVSSAAEAKDFYKGRTIRLILSTGVGGSLDTNARLVAHFWARHIPGHPAIVVQNMPGAGHVRAANYLANEAPRDGTVLGSFIPAFLLAQVLKTSSAIKFNAADFNWIGASSASNSTFYVWHTAPVKTMKDVLKTRILMGGTGAGSYTVIYPTIMNAIVGTKFKVVSGYATTHQINLALERGEVQGRAGNNFNSLEVENGEWLRDHKIRLLAQVGLKRDPNFPNVPLMTDFGRTRQDRKILRLFSSDVAVGRPFLTAPDVPKSRVALLRRSFEATMKDPAFLRAAKKAKIDVAPIRGAQLKKIVDQIINSPPAVVAKARAALLAAGIMGSAPKGRGQAANGGK